MDDWPYKSSTDLWCQPIKYPVSISIFRFSNSLHFGRSVSLSLLFALSECKFVCSVRFAESKVKLFNLFGHYTLFGTFEIMNELLLIAITIEKERKSSAHWVLKVAVALFFGSVLSIAFDIVQDKLQSVFVKHYTYLHLNAHRHSHFSSAQFEMPYNSCESWVVPNQLREIFAFSIFGICLNHWFFHVAGYNRNRRETLN